MFYEECAKQCFIECEYSVFSVASAYSEYPGRNYADYLKKSSKFVEKFTYEPNEELSFDTIRDSVLKLNVYFSWVNVYAYEEEPEMDVNEFLSNIGIKIVEFCHLN
jgi:hypothetical protein